jgi:hypothetical protein
MLAESSLKGILDAWRNAGKTESRRYKQISLMHNYEMKQHKLCSKLADPKEAG